MSHQLTIHLSSAAFAALQASALERGETTQRAAERTVEEVFGTSPAGKAARRSGNLRKWFGAVAIDDPRGADNESIDADLAKEYARGLDD